MSLTPHCGELPVASLPKGCKPAGDLLDSLTAAVAAPGSKVLPEHRKKCFKW